jgi:hypothetical protein
MKPDMTDPGGMATMIVPELDLMTAAGRGGCGRLRYLAVSRNLKEHAL